MLNAYLELLGEKKKKTIVENQLYFQRGSLKFQSSKYNLGLMLCENAFMIHRVFRGWLP